MNKQKLVKGLGCAMGFAKKSIQVVGPIMVAALYSKSTIQNIIGDIRYSYNVSYDDVIKEISDSCMFSSDKCKAVALVKVGKTSEYYKAIINIIQSTGFGSDKVKMIEAINNKLDEEPKG